MKRFILFLASLLVMVGTAQAQAPSTVRGKVTFDEDGSPLPGVSVMVKGTQVGTMTDPDGTYVLFNVPSNAKVLVFSFVGMTTQEVPVSAKVDVVMSNDSEALEELVVVAYGVAKKESVTGAVSTVKSDAIAVRPVSNVSNVLEGAVTGVLVNGGGDPGDSPSIRIRGFGSPNGDNNPLYVIDGVPFSGYISDINPNDIESLTVLKDATSAALYGNRASNGVIIITTKRGKSDRVSLSLNVNQGFYNRAIPDYDKVDAKDFMQVFFTGYVNNHQSGATHMSKEAAIADVRANILTYLGNYNIFNVATDQLYDSNGKFNYSAEVLPGYDDLNYWKYTERTGYRQDYNVSGSGASPKSNYYFSLGYTDEQGQTINSDMNRWTGRANVSVTPAKWIKAGLNISGSIHNENYRSTGTAYANPIYMASIMAPIYPVYLHNEDGSYMLDDNGNKQYDGGDTYARKQWLARHAIWESELDMRHLQRLGTSAQAYADITFLKDFTFSIKGDLGLRYEEDRTYNNSTIGDGAGTGRASRTSYFYRNYTFQQLLNWGHSFGNHNVEALIGHENYYYNYDYQYGYKQNETFAGGKELVNFTDITSLTGYNAGYRLESYFSRAKYNYNNKYFVEASFRRDGSSRFAAAKRWGNFWSLGATWAISREPFMQNVNWVDNLRLRASYGEVGNDRSVGYYGYMSLYSLTQKYAGVIAANKSQNEALDLVWEAEKSFSTALEGRLFNRFNFTLEYFNKITHDLLFDVEKPTSQGGISTGSVTAATTANIGSVSNYGIEFSGDVDIIKTRDFTWNFGVNATWMKNVILQLPPATITNYDGLQNAMLNGTKLWAEGHGIYDYYMYQYVGVDQLTGLALYKIDDEKYYIDEANKIGKRWNEDIKDFEDFEKSQVPEEYRVMINGKEYVMNTTYAKKDWAGTSLPKVYGSFNTSFRIKNFTLSAMFTYALGGKCLDYSYQSLMGVGDSPHAYHVDILNSWDSAPVGMEADSPLRIDPNGTPRIDGFWSSHSNATSTRFLTNGNYLVIKNVNLSYTFPKKVVDKMGIGGLTITASVDNLWSFTARKGLNPQQNFSGAVYGYNINTPRVGTVGVKVNF